MPFTRFWERCSAIFIESRLSKVSGVQIMTIHKSKGKQFDEVFVHEGVYRGRIVSDTTRMDQGRLTLRVAVTRAQKQATILTPRKCPCELLQWKKMTLFLRWSGKIAYRATPDAFEYKESLAIETQETIQGSGTLKKVAWSRRFPRLSSFLPKFSFFFNGFRPRYFIPRLQTGIFWTFSTIQVI